MAQQKAAMLTTTDNPFDPFLQWNEWYAYDEAQGYHTCGYLDRMSFNAPELSERDNNVETLKAMNAIIEIEGSERYKIVYKQ